MNYNFPPIFNPHSKSVCFEDPCLLQGTGVGGRMQEPANTLRRQARSKGIPCRPVRFSFKSVYKPIICCWTYLILQVRLQADNLSLNLPHSSPSAS